MRIFDLVYFIRQIFFPNRKPKEQNRESENSPSRFVIWIRFIAKKLRSKENISATVSLLTHLLLLLIFSWFMLPKINKWNGINILSNWNQPENQTPEISIIPGKVEIEIEEKELKPEDSDALPNPPEKVIANTQSEAASDEMPTPIIGEEISITEQPSTITNVGSPNRRKGDFVSGGGYEGRNPQGRGQSVGNGSCSVRGENAVEAALQWLAVHQQKDGGWDFNFDESCHQCTKSGTHGSRIAATGLALLPFLGAGYTHQINSPYKKTVDNGLFFLISRSVEEQRGTALNRGTQSMYSHGIASIALCEAYAMSQPKQPKLAHTAQEVLRFIENAQDRNGGGWRYNPNEPGDISVSAWQIMALKSGKLGGLYVAQPTIYLANDFIESVATDGGRQFNYLPSRERIGTGPDSPKTSTATGLLLRMYLGWEPGDDDFFDDGVNLVAQWGPILKKENSDCNLYYAYYGTLLLHHYGGSAWQRWNSEIQEFLIQTQSKQGHEAGSWFFPDHYGDKGGRILNTVLATLILETPYRIMPLFRKP